MSHSYDGSAIKGEQLLKTLTEAAKDLKGKADKASSGNGMLAVIGASGNYASSGITAFNQSQINGVF